MPARASAPEDGELVLGFAPRGAVARIDMVLAERAVEREFPVTLRPAGR